MAFGSTGVWLPLLLVLSAAPLFQEQFEDPQALARWKAVDGARLQGWQHGPASTASLDEGALKLESPKGARRWVALTHEVMLPGADWIRVSARMRSDSIALRDSPLPNANLLVQFPGERVQGFRRFSGTQPWTTLVRMFEVPQGATRVELGCFLSAPGTMWFDDVDVEAVPAPAFVEFQRGPLHALGQPPALIAEGLAVYFSGNWQHVPVKLAARRVLQGGRWRSLDALLETSDFVASPDDVTYPIAGALLEWIVDRYGREKTLALYRELSRDSPKVENRRRFQELLGVSLDNAEAQLKAGLLK